MYQEQPTTDQLFKITMIDRARKIKMNIQLCDKGGDEIPIRETIEKLTEWVADKIQTEEANVCKQQIFPLMGQAIVGGMVKLMGPDHAAFMLSQEPTRYSLIHMMTVGFYLFKWLQRHEIQIHTYEESITAEEIEMYDRISHASDLSVQTAALGGNPKDMVRELLRTGKLKQSDLHTLGIELETKQNTDGDN
jgi:hypothetical protein